MRYQRWPENPLTLVRSRTQCLAMVTKLLSSYCGALLAESYCKEYFSDTDWRRYLFSSYLMNEKRCLKILNSNFLLIQTTCLCFKMASIGKTLTLKSVLEPSINTSFISTKRNIPKTFKGII